MQTLLFVTLSPSILTHWAKNMRNHFTKILFFCFVRILFNAEMDRNCFSGWFHFVVNIYLFLRISKNCVFIFSMFSLNRKRYEYHFFSETTSISLDSEFTLLLKKINLFCFVPWEQMHFSYENKLSQTITTYGFRIRLSPPFLSRNYYLPLLQSAVHCNSISKEL